MINNSIDKEYIIKFLDNCVTAIKSNKKWMAFNILLKKQVRYWYLVNQNYKCNTKIPIPIIEIVENIGKKELYGSVEYAMLINNIRKYI